MQTIEVDNEVYANLELAHKLTGLSHAEIVRQWMRQRMTPADFKGSTGSHDSKQPEQQKKSQPRDIALTEYVRSPGFLASRSVVDQFLNILSFLEKHNADKFATLESLEGRKRRYVARSEQELENFGTSVNAKRIPNTSFWVVTNNSTDNKKILLGQVLTVLGYSQETIRSVPESLR